MEFGIDVSSNNTIAPGDWPKIAAYLKSLGSNKGFVIVKITQGNTYVNPDIAVQVAGARSVGLAVSGYLMDQGNASPVAEETFFRAHSLGLPQEDDIELPEGLSVATYAAHAYQLIALDPSAMSYLNQSEVSEGFPATNLWLAEYNDAPGTVSHPCLMHQYSSTTNIPGCTGEFDMNVWLGSQEQFDQHFGLTQPQPAHPVVTNKMLAQCNAMMVDPLNRGYWLVGSDGGVFTHSFTNKALPFFGSAGGLHLNAPIVGGAPTSTGKGYLLVGADGGIFTYGDAPFYGSTGNMKLARPIVGVAFSADGKGYYLFAADGGVFTFGAAQFAGSGS